MFLAYSISQLLDRFMSRIGAMTGRSVVLNTASNLSWSFPLPVQPWARASAFSLRATSTHFFAIRGLASDVPMT